MFEKVDGHVAMVDFRSITQNKKKEEAVYFVAIYQFLFDKL